MISNHKGKKMVKDGEDFTDYNGELEKFRLNFSRCANRTWNLMLNNALHT